MKTTLLDLLFQNRELFGNVIPKSLLRKTHREVNLAEEVVHFMKTHPKLKFTFKDLINPYKYPKLIDRVHKEMGVAWSYGGWLENRSVIFQYTYLKNTQSWIHLGIDINVPIGTPVLAALDGTIHSVNTDYPEEGGWGNYVILRHQIDGITFFSITGHLGKKGLVAENQKVPRGEILGYVGKIGENGFWRPHTHFQFISQTEMQLRENPWTLDGYGKAQDLSYLREHYPNPLVCLPMGEKSRRK